MTPRRADDGVDEVDRADEVDVELHDVEEEELGSDPVRASGRAVDPVSPHTHRGIARFGIGALLLLAAVGLLVAGFTQPYYEMDLREGPQQDGGEDTSDRIVFRLALDDWVRLDYDDGEGSPTRESEDYGEAPVPGILMTRVAWTGYVGTGLIGLALLAGVLHRFGALTVAGPAPVLAVFGVVVLVAGLVPFVLDVAHHMRIEFLPGRLDRSLLFFSSGVDGDVLHDLAARPLLGFWLHAAGFVAAAAGTVFMFWNEWRRALASVGRFAADDGAARP